jgi:Hint domain
MGTGSRATFVFSWAQTEVDGVVAAPLEVLAVGAVWRWTGGAVRLDGAPDILLLDGALGQTDLRRRAARAVRRLVGAALSAPTALLPEGPVSTDQSFVVTDGRSSHVLTVIDVPGQAALLLMAVGSLPPVDTDLWVVRSDVVLALAPAREAEAGMICFAAGTRIATSGGPCPVEALRPGDRVLTADDGPQPVLWTGGRRVTGARLHVMPGLRPVRLRGGALGADGPSRDLLVSPGHRMLVRGPVARALFNVSEVLVAAEDLADGVAAVADRSLREVTYVHLLFDRHQILFAEGAATESFRPGPEALEMLMPDDRARLLAACPSLAPGAAAYGPPARRLLTSSETAILRHDRAA